MYQNQHFAYSQQPIVNHHDAIVYQYHTPYGLPDTQQIPYTNGAHQHQQASFNSAQTARNNVAPAVTQQSPGFEDDRALLLVLSELYTD